MSHLAVHLLAEGLRDTDHGINAVAEIVPRLVGDPLPERVTVYDELSHDWLAQGQLPSEESDDRIAYPCALVLLSRNQFEDGTSRYAPEGTYTEGTVTLAVQVCVRDTESAEALHTLMYLLRAVRGAVIAFCANTRYADRTALGTMLYPSTSTEIGGALVPMGDDIVSNTVLFTFPVTEASPVP